MFSADEAPKGDTADPLTADQPAPEAAPDDASDEGAADGTAEGDDGGDEEGDGSADADDGDGSEGTPEASEDEGSPGPQGRRPRRRKRPQARRGGAGGGGNKPQSTKPTPKPAPEGDTEEEVEDTPEPEPEPAPKPAPSTPTPKPGGITQISDTHWQVTKANFERWKSDPYALGGGISQQGDGWKVRWIRKREAWHLGMKNNDVILQINGKKLKNKAQMAAAYLALKNKDDFEVLFERKGKQMTHRYTVK